MYGGYELNLWGQEKTPAEGDAFDRGFFRGFSPYLMTMRRVVVLNEPELNCIV